MIAALFRWLTGGALSRILSTVDKRIDAQTDREKLKADIIQEAYRTRGDWLRAGGFWLMLIFALPLGGWWTMALYDTALGCADCLLSNNWTVAALPEPLDEWAGLIVVSIFGVLGVDRLKR